MFEQSRTTERLIFFFAALTFCVLAYFLYDDSLFRNQSNNTNLTRIGNILESHEDVRLKNNNNFLWMKARAEDRVYKGDSVFTGPNSTATITLEDGSKLELKPNSLVVLNFDNNQMKLDLKFGQLVGELSENAKVRIQNKGELMEIDGKGSKLEIGSSMAGDARIKVLEGQASLGGKTIGKDQTVEVDTAGKLAAAENVTLTLMEPENEKTALIRPNSMVSFAWDSTGPIATYELQLSDSAAFTGNVFRRSTADKKYDLTKFPSTGFYYWRVRALSKTGTELAKTEPFQIEFKKITTPQILTPQNLAQFKFERNEYQELIDVPEIEATWEDPMEKEIQNPEYTVQLSKSAQFSEVLVEEKTQELSWKSPELESGKYFLRVQAQIDETNSSGWSTPVEFSILYPEVKVMPSVPILVEDRISLELPTAEAPKVEWRKSENADSYYVEIASSKDFDDETIVSQGETKNLTWVWDRYRLGQYYYRVQAFNNYGNKSRHSEMGSLRVRSKGPELEPVPPILARGQDKQAPPKTVDLKWSEVFAAKSYTVEVSKTADFKKSQKKIARDPASALTLPGTGNYYWRVQPNDATQKPMTEFSPPSEIQYQYVNPPPMPTVLTPKKGITYFMAVAAEPYIFLEWKKQQNVETYEIEVSRSPDFSTYIIKDKIKVNRFLIQQKMPAGTYYWRIRSNRMDLDSDWSESREFHLMSAK